MNTTSVKTRVTRNDRRRERTRVALLDAANLMFHEKGIDATTVTDITNQADVAYGSFYNHFKDMHELITAQAELTMYRVVNTVRKALQDKLSDIGLTASFGVRAMLRILSHDPATLWLVERPHTFVNEYRAVITPFMREVEGAAASDGRMNPAGGQETWLRAFPWLLLCELQDVLRHSNLAEREVTLARLTLRLHGVDDETAQNYIDSSGVLAEQLADSASD